MSINEKDIEKLSQLSKIKLSSQEELEFVNQLGDILDYVDKVQKYDFTSDKSIKIDSESFLREDVVVDFDSDLLIDQFSDRDQNLLRVKKVL